jgi:hypothetical protein
MKLRVATSSLCCSVIGLAMAAGLTSSRAAQGSPVASPVRTVIVQNYYFARADKADEVFRWRLHASDVRVALGLPRGRVLRRLASPAGDTDSAAAPDVIWECEYPNTQARDADVARLGQSDEFRQVEAHMDTLIREFRRGIYEAQAGEAPHP